jgi:hypothetical protein
MRIRKGMLGGSINVQDSVPVLDKEGHMVRSFSLRSDISFSHLYVIDSESYFPHGIGRYFLTTIPLLVPITDDEHPINHSNNLDRYAPDVDWRAQGNLFVR